MMNQVSRLLAALLIAAVFLTVADGAARAQQLAETPQPAAPRATMPAPAKPPAPAKDLKQIAPPSLFEQVRSLQNDVEAMKARLQNAEKQIGTLQSGVSSLQSGMSSLQNKLSDYVTKTSYTCKTVSVSRNGAGVEQNCSPYRCRNIDGRCAPQTCASVDDCAPGYVCLPDAYKCALP